MELFLALFLISLILNFALIILLIKYNNTYDEMIKSQQELIESRW